MIQQFIHTLIISLICIIWGTPVLLLFSGTIVKANFWYHSLAGLFCFLFFSGCITLSIVSSWLVLFAPLRFYLWLALTIALFLYQLAFKRTQIVSLLAGAQKTVVSLSFIEYLYLGISILLFFILGSLKPVNLDTQIYHLQIIRWQSEYGVVPGIANLSPRFGLGSNWFNLISILNIPGFNYENYSYLNITFVTCFFLWLFLKYKYYIGKKETHPYNKVFAFFYFVIFLYFMLDWQLSRDAANSTNYDFPVVAFTIIAIACLTEEIMNRQSGNDFSGTFLLFALTIISFKFSGIFILLLIGYYIFLKKKTKHLLTAIIAGFFILVPVLIKNYIVTGYPLYPYPLSINTPDWQLPKELTQGIYHYIINSNRFYNYLFLADTVGNAQFNWVQYWFKGILIQHKIVILMAVISIIALSITKPIPGLNYKEFRRFLIVLFLMIAGWFLTAPDPARFGYGILVPAAMLGFSVYAGNFLNISIYKTILFFSMLVVGLYGYKKSIPLLNEPKYLLYPMETDKPTYKTYYVKGIAVHIPDFINGNWDHRCYNTILPCTGSENPYLQPRGKKLKDGFYMFPYPDSSFFKKYVY